MLRRFALPITVLSIPILLLASRPVAEGITYSFTISSTSTDDRGRSRDVNSMSGRAQVTNDHARMDIDESRNQPMMERGSYLIMQTQPPMFYMVNPKKKEYVEFAVDNMARGMSGGSPGMGMVRIEVTNPRTSGESAGSGGEVNGQQTQLYRITQEYGMATRVLGRRNATTNKSVTEFYVAPALRGFANPLMNFGQNLAASLMPGSDGGGMQELLDQAAAEQQRLFGNGTPVRMVTRMTVADDRGRASEMVSTMDITNIKHGDVPASVFALPAGYQRISMDVPTSPEGAEAGEQKQEPEQRRGNPLRRAIPRP